MCSSDGVRYMFELQYPNDPNDEKQWTHFLDQVRNHPPSEYSRGKCISLYFYNKIDTYAFIMLLDGNQLGKAMAAQLTKKNYRQLPIASEMDATVGNPKWELFEQNILVGKKECWELFMGDLASENEQNHYLFGTFEEAQDAFKAGHDVNPLYNAYILRHFFKPGAPTSTTEYFPLSMP